jgi:hypothetical protein
MADGTPSGKLETLHSNLIKEGYSLPDYKTFAKDMEDGDKLSKLYTNLKSEGYSLPDKFETFQVDMFGGVEPSKKKDVTEKPATVSPAGGGSSGLLSVKFGGDQYEVNPKTQEVFMGGKRVTVPQNIKDYIAKNMLGLELPKQQVGAAGELTPEMYGGGVAGEPVVDKLATQAIQKGLTGVAGETKPSISPDIKNILSKNFVDVEVFENANPDILEQAAKDLKEYTGTDVDLKYPETLDKAIGEAKILRDTDAFNKMAAEASMTPKQAQSVAFDYAAEKFLGDDDNELYRIQKQVDSALQSANKEELKKLQPLWEQAKKNFLNKYNDDISSLQKQIATRRQIGGLRDGMELTADDLANKKKELSLLQQQYVGFTQSPAKLADNLIKTDSSLSALDQQLKNKTPNQKLGIIGNAYIARYFLLGRKLGIKTSDILNEGNIRFMTTDRGDKGLVEWSLDNIKNYMGYGDLDGEVTSNDRKEFAELHGKLKTLLPVLLINKSPIQAEEDKIGDIFVKTASQFAPATQAQNMTGQQVANTLQGILSQANIDNTELTPTAIQAIDTKLKKYGWGQSLAQMGGQTAQIVIPMMVSGGLSGAAIETLALSPRTAFLARFLLNNPIGKIAKGAAQYRLAGEIAGNTDELDLGTGGTAGAVDAALDALGGKFKMLKPWLRLKFGKKAGEIASYIATQGAKGGGEFIQESGETIYQAWRDTPEGKSTFDTLKQQFGDVDDIVKFAVGTIIMGSGMSMASDLGFDKARLDAVRQMTPEQRAKFDAAVTYFKDQDNQVAKGAIDEVLPKAKTEVLEDNIDDITAVKNKLQSEIDKIQSEDDVTPYSVTVNGVTYSGTTPQELRADLDYIEYVSNKTNEELYKRTQETETPTDTEQVQQQPIAEEGVGVGEVSDTANLPQDVQDKIAKLRADEQADLRAAIPNIDEYKVDGEIDRDKILASPDADAYSEIYDRYDKLITPLLETTVTETTTENLPQGGEVKETVSEKQVAEPTNLEEGNIATPEEYDELEKFYKEEERKAGSEYPKLSYKEEFIHKNIGRVDAQQLIDAVGEKAFKDGKMALRFTKKGAEPIDTVADVLSQDAGIEITPQDIFDYFLDRTAFGGRYVKQKVGNYKAATNSLSKIEAKSKEIQNKILDLSDEGVFADNLDINSPDVIMAAEFLFDGEDLALIKEELNRLNLPENANERNQLRQSLQAKRQFQSNLRTGESTEIEGAIGEEAPTPKVDEGQAKPIGESPQDVTGNIGTDKDAAEKTEATDKDVDKVAEATGTKAKNIRDLYDINRKLFGQDRVKSLAAAVAMDRMIGVMAKRAGTTKAEMYARIRFQKASETDLPQGVKMQVDAWHGSPYEFDKFTTEKIGTGEGAQAFGWGLYFTDLKGIAEDYAKQLSALNSKILIDGKEQIMIPDHVLYIVKDILEANGGDIEKTIEAAKDRMEGYSDYLDFAQSKNSYNKFDKAIKYLEKNKERVKLIADRNLYKVSLHEGKAPSDYTWLEWDKPLTESKIKELSRIKEIADIVDVIIQNKRNLEKKFADAGVKKEFKNDISGKQVYEGLSKLLGGDKQASLFLLENGIDGIKYPAESISRGANSDTARGFNYVVFDENAVSVKDVIKFQKDANKARGAAMVAMDGNAVIYALTDPNVSTPLHEVAHVFEHYLTDGERATINNWANTGAWTTETSEKFARGFEKYLSEGIAPTEGLKKVFEKFKTWLTDIYNGIKGSDIDIELNDDMRSIYAKMLGEDAVPAKKAKAAKAKTTKPAIPTETIDKLVGKATDRRAAVEAIADENIKEVAKAVTDTKVIDKVMDAIDNNDQLLADLEKKLGMKKICKVF